jgi:hypothetical protein
MLLLVARGSDWLTVDVFLGQVYAPGDWQMTSKESRHDRRG